GPPAAGCPWLPHLCIIEPLQRFIRTQEQARHIPTDMVKALSTAKHLPIRSQTTADRLGHTNKRHHRKHPVSGRGSRTARGRALLARRGPAPSWRLVLTRPPPPDAAERGS